MNRLTSSAWVLIKDDVSVTRFIEKEIQIDELEEDEILVKSLYGCLEGNFVHAVNLKPEDIFKARDEDEIVLGNSGVVEIEEIGSNVEGLSIGDKCIYFCNGEADEFGYPKRILAFDKKNSFGLFAKKFKIHKTGLIKIPHDSKFGLKEWAAFSLKYITAWSNWKVAYACWNSQMSEVSPSETYVFGWGGGVTLSQLALANKFGCKSYLLTSDVNRKEILSEKGVVAIDRNLPEEILIQKVNEITEGKGVSIFIDNIGHSVYKKTLKLLGRQGVITTSGWKTGGMLPLSRANECLNRHIHVFTHYARYKEGIEAIQYALENDWLPNLEAESFFEWSDIPELVNKYADGKVDNYFPIFKIN